MKAKVDNVIRKVPTLHCVEVLELAECSQIQSLTQGVVELCASKGVWVSQMGACLIEIFVVHAK